MLLKTEGSISKEKKDLITLKKRKITRETFCLEIFFHIFVAPCSLSLVFPLSDVNEPWILVIYVDIFETQVESHELENGLNT